MSKKTKKLSAEEKARRKESKRKKKIIKAVIVCSIIAVVIACTVVSAVLITHNNDRENQLYNYKWVPVSAQNASKDEVEVREVYGDIKYTNYQGSLKFNKDGTFDFWMAPGLPDDGTHTGKYELDGDTIKASFDEGTQTEFYIERENGYIKDIRLGYNEYTVYFGQGEKNIEEKTTEEN